MKIATLLDAIRIDMPIVLMVLAILASAIVVIYTKHIGRSEFVTLQKLEYHRDHLNEEWGRLLLEESTWAGPGRVEQQARLRLKMIVPTAEMTVVIKP
jgi:cell division protein FtsL